MFQNSKAVVIPVIIAIVASLFIYEALRAVIQPGLFNPLVNIGIGIAILGVSTLFTKTWEGTRVSILLIVAVIFISLGYIIQ